MSDTAAAGGSGNEVVGGYFRDFPRSDLSKGDQLIDNTPQLAQLSQIGEQSRGLTLTWQNLSVSVVCRQDQYFGFIKRSYLKKIVDNGAVTPGSLVALMGPSGAGKSTMLSALAGRAQGGSIITGDIKLNGRTIDDSIRGVTGYMYQEDCFIAVLTVREHLRYMARLKMDRRTSRRQREQRIDTLLELLSLTSLADTRIGGAVSNGEKLILSGGEKKRLSFATACLTLPPLLYVDEPTTGLDSFTAARLVASMKSIVTSTGSSMIATIHQPSPETLSMFSSIMLVADGRLVYFGPSNEAVGFLQECGYEKNEMVSDGEFMMRCVAPKWPKLQENATTQMHMSARKLAATYETSRFYSNIRDSVDYYCEMDHQPAAAFNFKKQFWITQLYWLFVRGMVEFYRNPEVQWIRIVQKLLIALTAGVCYFGTIHMDQKGVQAVQGVLFLLVTENVFAPMYAVMAVYPKEYPLFIREHRNGAYSTSAYYLAKILCIAPGAVLEAVLFTTLLYILAGLRLELYPYLLTNLFTVLCICVSTACGALFSNAFGSIPLAMMYLLPLEYISMITSGIFLKLSSLAWTTSWVRYISWLMYTYESMSVIQWRGVENITCPADEALRSACLTNGLEVMEHYDFSESHLTRNFVSLVSFFLFLQFLGYQFFRRKIQNHF